MVAAYRRHTVEHWRQQVAGRNAGKGCSMAQFIQDESGATAIEYALIAALISLAVVGTFPLIGTNLNNIFTAVAAGFVF
jgi:pilus assembly protein Flp/PilA